MDGDEPKKQVNQLQRNAPKIVLEALSARSIVQIMAIIIVSFIGCFALDTNITYNTFSAAHQRNQYLTNCTGATLNSILSGHVSTHTGCMASGDGPNGTDTSWFGLYGNLFNVLGVDVSFHSTELSTEAPTGKAVAYDYLLYGCALSDGCGNVETKRGKSYSDWHLVAEIKGHDAHWYPETPVATSHSSTNDDGIEKEAPKDWQLNFFHILQNQEALPSNGYVKSYYLRIDIHDNTDSVFRDPRNYIVVNISEGSEGVLVRFFELLTIVLMLTTIGALYYYVQMVVKYQKDTQGGCAEDKWLPEQIWVCAYLVILLLFQNPFYIGADLAESNPHSALTAFVVSYMAQTAFMALWLCMADSMSYDDSSWFSLAKFYAPKVTFGIIIFIPACVMLGFQFPSIQNESATSSMLAVQMWPLEERRTFITFSFIFLLLYWGWALAWFIRLYLTHRRLSAMPYISTRYQQLLFRFYLLQMSFVAIYSILQYAFAAYYIGYSEQNAVKNSVEMADDVNILFKQQTEMFGKIIFLSIVGYLLAFVTLPSGYILTGDDFINVASVFAITDVEKMELLELRKEYVEQRVRINRLRLGINAFSGTQRMMRGDFIFCLEQALDLLRVSYEVYDETEGDLHLVRASMSKTLASYGFNIVQLIAEPERQLLCVICRQVSTNRLVVAFRGTVSMVNMKVNLDRALVPYEPKGMPELDVLDGLDDNLDSIPDDDEDTPNRASIFSVRLSGLWRKKDKDTDADSGNRKSKRLTKSQRLNRKKINEVVLGDSLHIDNPVVSGAGDGEEGDMETGHGRGESVKGSVTAARSSSDEKMRASLRLSREVDEAKLLEQHEKRRKGEDRADKKAIELATTAITQTGNIFLLALHNTPGLSALAIPRVHTGFLGSYNAMREQINRVLRNELRENPGEVCVTGHSLGGALATLCVIDIAVHTLPRVRGYFRRKEAAERTNQGIAGRVSAAMYTFGQPRVGDAVFSSVFDNLCPESFRVVVDGDVIASVPKNAGGYRHAGTSVIVDSREVGNIIVDPSFVERFFRTKKVYLGVSVHSLVNYEECLLAVKRAAGATGVVVSAATLENLGRSGAHEPPSPENPLQRIIRESVARQSQMTKRSISDDSFATARDTLSPLGHKRLSETQRTSILNEL